MSTRKDILDVPAFADSQLKLLSAELVAETASTTTLLASQSPAALARAGLAVLNLVVGSQRTGLGGKLVLDLEQDSAIGTNKLVLTEHGIRVGDIVRVGKQPKGSERKKEKAAMEKKGVEGVVIRVNQKGLNVALGKEDDELDALAGKIWV